MWKTLKTLLIAFGKLPATPHDRRSAQKTVAFDLCKKFNLRLYHQHVRWPDDDAFLTMMRAFKPQYSRIRDRNYSLYQFAKSVAELDGDTAECGVLAGDGSYIICHATKGKHHLFDSFEGLSEIRAEDQHGIDSVKQYAAGDLSVSEQTVQQNLSQFADRLEFHKGWIPDRFKDVSDQAFSLVHLDVDLYQPTIDSLEFFYPRLVPGGLVICDDYGLYSCPGAHQAVNEYCEKVGAHSLHLTCGQAVITKRP